MKDLTPARRSELRARAHHLHPVVSIAANGLTPTVLAEIGASLQAHELIKIKTYGADREARQQLMTEVCEALGASPVQQIGNILVVWRERIQDEKKAGASLPAAPKGGIAKSKSASAFAAAARRTALAKAAADKRRIAEKRARGPRKPS